MFVTVIAINQGLGVDGDKSVSIHKLNIVEFLASANQDEIALEAINEVEGYYEGKVIWFEYEDIGKKRKYWKCDGIKQICKPISICVVTDQLLRRKDKEIVKGLNRKYGKTQY